MLTSPPMRYDATPRAACAPWRSRNSRASSACRRSHDRDHYWEPFFAACNDTGTAIFMHIGSGSHWMTSSPDAPPAVTALLGFMTSVVSLSALCFPCAVAPHSNPRVCFPEGQTGLGADL